MKTLVLIVIAVVSVGALLAAAQLGQRWREQRRVHDAVEYYERWGGYDMPIRLINQITKEQAEAQAARGEAYMIGHFDPQGRLVRAVKMLRGAVFFDQQYSYDPRGRLVRITITDADGVTRSADYPEGVARKSLW
jgi:Family of unknown function (DUF6156)/RHS Repeat